MPGPHDRIVDAIAARTGLAFSASQRTELEQHVARRVTALSAGDSLAWLDDPIEFRAVIDCLTVRETYFFRYEEQFHAFRDHLLPAMLTTARSEGRKVRVWSAGCCSGEEPYTLALIASELGVLGEIEIFGTDINENYLEAAIIGAFSRRSVERVPSAILDRYFTGQGDRFVLREDLRRAVEFKWLNLAECSYPSFLNGTSALDMIWCRNVLIYFDKTHVRTIIDRFAECLLPHGALALGHSEMLPRDWTLTVAQIGATFFYRRTGEQANRPIGVPPIALAISLPPRPATRARPIGPVAITPPPPPTPSIDPHALLDRAESFADHGRIDDAVSACMEAIGIDPSLERAHYLLGLLTIDRPEQAHAHFRKAVYLEPGHLPARLHLAQCAEKLGRTEEVIREYRNLERQAATRQADEVLDPREGITVGMVTLIGRRALSRYRA